MDILDFSINSKLDYGKDNPLNLKKLTKAAEEDKLGQLQVTDGGLAALEKEICVCGYIEEAKKLLRAGNPNWFRDGLRYYTMGVTVIDPYMDTLWDKRFKRILSGRPVMEQTPSPFLRLLVGVLAMAFFTAAAAVFLVPDILLLLREYSAEALVGAMGVILIPLSLFFSFIGLIFAGVILINIFEELGPWLAQQPEFLQDWAAPAAVALVLALIGILLFIKFRSMPARSKARKAYEAALTNYRTQVEKKIKEAEEYVLSCRLYLAMQGYRITEIAELLLPDDSSDDLQQEEYEIIRLYFVKEGCKELLDRYDTYEERLKKMKAEL